MVPNILSDFVKSLDQYDWFCDAEVDAFGRLVVYVSKMDINFIGKCPNEIAGYHVLFHFDCSQSSKEEVEELTDEDIIEVHPSDPGLTWEDDELLMGMNSVDPDELIMELDRLEKICGSNILQDIFFELHDGKNAVTNLSARFPEVRESMEKLYRQYGFDVIYEELDG